MEQALGQGRLAHLPWPGQEASNDPKVVQGGVGIEPGRVRFFFIEGNERALSFFIDLDPDTGLLQHHSQDGWEIHYKQYGEFGQFTLPRQLQIRRGMTEAKVVISHWQTVPG